MENQDEKAVLEDAQVSREDLEKAFRSIMDDLIEFVGNIKAVITPLTENAVYLYMKTTPHGKYLARVYWYGKKRKTSRLPFRCK